MSGLELAVGCGTSIILLITVIVLIKRSFGVTLAGTDATGILPSMWIAYHRPELRELFLEVTEPTIDNLRTMGMVEMQLADEKVPSALGSNISQWEHHPVSSSEPEEVVLNIPCLQSEM